MPATSFNPQVIDLGDDGRLVLDTTLTKSQVNKFKGLISRLIVVNNTAYLRLDELHGVLLTGSKEKARLLVMNHQDMLKPYLVTDRVMFQPFSSAIKPAGVYLLLDHLTAVNPKKAADYRASLVLLAYIMAKHPGVALGSWRAAKEQFQAITKAMKALKQLHQTCQVTGYPFSGDDDKHVHHLEGQAENPSLAANADNMVVLHGWVHDDYHSWLIQQKLPTTKATFWFYADKKGYSTDFLRSLKAK